MTLWAHQRRMVDFAAARQRCFWAAGMGSGKTRAALTLAAETKARLTVVGCPLSVIPAWEQQTALWYPKAKVIRLDGRGSSKVRCVHALEALDRRKPTIIVGNYESMWRMPRLLELSPDLLVADEAHRLKSHNGKASKFFAKMSKSAGRVIGLSGTLLGQTPLDAFGVWRACGLGHRMPRTLTAFRDQFAVMNPRVRGWIMGWKNLDEFERIIAQDTIRVRSEDVLDLPERVHSTVPVELSPAEVTAYTNLKDEMVHEAGGNILIAPNRLVLVLRLLQACSGHIRWDDTDAPERIVEVPSKAAALADIASDIDQPLVVFYRFTAEAEDIRRALKGKKVGELSGRTNNLAAFQAGKLDAIAVQIQAGGTGIDLTRASHAIYYSGSPSVTDMDQSYARLHRPGAKSTVFITHLVAQLPGAPSADSLLYRGLKEKGDLLESILSKIG